MLEAAINSNSKRPRGRILTQSTPPRDSQHNKICIFSRTTYNLCDVAPKIISDRTFVPLRLCPLYPRLELAGVHLALVAAAGLAAGAARFAGAGLAAAAVFFLLDRNLLLREDFFQSLDPGVKDPLVLKLVLLAGVVLLVSLSLSLWLSYRKSIRKGLKMWTPVSKRFLANLLVPLVTGGILIMVFIAGGQWQLILPSMLIFYGLALVGATKFTYGDIFYLGILEVILGLCAAAAPAIGLLLWTAGFGLLHIIYGIVMYRKYER